MVNSTSLPHFLSPAFYAEQLARYFRSSDQGQLLSLVSGGQSLPAAGWLHTNHSVWGTTSSIMPFGDPMLGYPSAVGQKCGDETRPPHAAEQAGGASLQTDELYSLPPPPPTADPANAVIAKLRSDLDDAFPPMMEFALVDVCESDATGTLSPAWDSRSFSPVPVQTSEAEDSVATTAATSKADRSVSAVTPVTAATPADDVFSGADADADEDTVWVFDDVDMPPKREGSYPAKGSGKTAEYTAFLAAMEQKYDAFQNDDSDDADDADDEQVLPSSSESDTLVSQLLQTISDLGNDINAGNVPLDHYYSLRRLAEDLERSDCAFSLTQYHWSATRQRLENAWETSLANASDSIREALVCLKNRIMYYFPSTEEVAATAQQHPIVIDISESDPFSDSESDACIMPQPLSSAVQGSPTVQDSSSFNPSEEEVLDDTSSDEDYQEIPRTRRPSVHKKKPAKKNASRNKKAAIRKHHLGRIRTNSSSSDEETVSHATKKPRQRRPVDHMSSLGGPAKAGLDDLSEPSELSDLNSVLSTEPANSGSSSRLTTVSPYYRAFHSAQDTAPVHPLEGLSPTFLEDDLSTTSGDPDGDLDNFAAGSSGSRSRQQRNMAFHSRDSSLNTTSSKKTRKNYSREATGVLMDWYLQHDGRSPDPANKENLARLANKSVVQISTWFQNARRRHQPKLVRYQTLRRECPDRVYNYETFLAYERENPNDTPRPTMPTTLQGASPSSHRKRSRSDSDDYDDGLPLRKRH